jgi:phage terminase small subunit
MGLTAKQERFCREYLTDLCGAQAAIRAGYSPAAARQTSCLLLTNPNIQKKVEALKAERAKSLDITAERVLKELARLAFGDPSEIVSVGEHGRITVKPTSLLTEDQRRTIQSVSQTADGLKIKFADKLRALELVGKHIGLFEERIRIEGPKPVEALTDAELEEIARDGQQT